ncbi:MAG TPA: suppressor of fused domain protein [Gemmatimonadaceae bacterium]|nr:suppressor of fused domain protein [Gemmatimonadaceae bacterium]
MVSSNEPPTLLERAWAQREETVYPALFGALEPSIAPLDAALFRDMFRQEAIDPRWLHVGVLIAPPTAARASWIYMSSGLSNPWESDEPEELSGLGCELILEAPTRADWPVLRLQHAIAFEILLAAGRYPGRERLGRYDRLPLRSPITFTGDSLLRFLLIAPTSSPASFFQLESGQVELMTLVGITEDEAEFARTHGGDMLVEQLQRDGAFPVTLPERHSVLSKDE